MTQAKAAVDIDMLTMALQASGDDGCWWLDTRSGEVLFGSPSERPQSDSESGSSRYIDIDPIEAEILLELMESFIATLDEEACREKLQTALQRQQADWHFKQALAHHPAEEDDWYAFKDQFYALQARQWLRDRDLEHRQVNEEAQPTIADYLATTDQDVLLSLSIQSKPGRRYVLWQTSGDLESMTLTAYENESDVLAETNINAHQYQGIERLLRQQTLSITRQQAIAGLEVILECSTDNGQLQFTGLMQTGDWLDQLQTTLGLILALPVISTENNG